MKTFSLYVLALLTIFVLPIPAVCQQIKTIAGGNLGHVPYPGVGGPAYNASFMELWTIAIGPDGSTYVADDGETIGPGARCACVQKIDPYGNITTVAGGIQGTPESIHLSSKDGGQATATALSSPRYVAIDAKGNLYIGESYYNVYKVSPLGIISTIIQRGAVSDYSGDGGPATNASIKQATGIAVDKTGNIYIADLWNYCVRKIDTFGIISTFAGGSSSLTGADGSPATAAFIGPTSVAIDTAGNVLIGEGSRVRKVDQNGIITTLVGYPHNEGYAGDGGPAIGAKLNGPLGIALDKKGNLYIADAGTNCIRKVDASGIITTVAGTGVEGYSGDGGPATDARLWIPRSVAVADNYGTLRITDNRSYIRQIGTKWVGLQNVQEADPAITLSPNPATDMVTINGIKSGFIKITDMAGRIVQQQATTGSFSVYILPTGIYLIKVFATDGRLLHQQKLVKD